MDILFELPDIIRSSKLRVDEILSNSKKADFNEELIIREKDSAILHNLLYHGDNIDAIVDLLHRGYGCKLDLIYIDPPFYTLNNYSNRVDIEFNGKPTIIEYVAYNDTWKGGFREYLEMLTVRIMLMKELLSDIGSIYVHIDFRTVHYIKIIMDYIFGTENFLNEIIWSYKSGGTSKKHFSRKHDNILLYTKTKNYIFHPIKEKSYNRGFKPYRFKGVEEYEDELGWYTLVNSKDVWPIDMVGRTSRERVGYETQKPEKLIEKIILSSTNEDSIVADFFAGSGTTLATADKLGRKWVGSDKGNSSILTILKRLGSMKSSSFTKISYNQGITISDLLFSNFEDLNYLNIKLEKYLLNLGEFKFKKKDTNLVEEILRENSLSLIDYISIKSVGDKQVIIYEDFKTRDKKNVNSGVNIMINNNLPLYINIIDIFGNMLYKEIL